MIAFLSRRSPKILQKLLTERIAVSLLDSTGMRRFPPPWTVEALDGGFSPSARIMERPNEDDGHHRVGI